MANPLKILTVLTASQAAKFEQGLDVNNQKVTNVAAGTVSSDGVNYGQLTDVSGAIKSYVDAQDTALSGAFDTRLTALSGAAGTALAAEIAARIAADSALSSSMKAYVDAADTVLDGRISTVSGAIKSYVDAADGVLQGNLDAVSGAIVSYVDSENAAQDAAVSALSGAFKSYIDNADAQLDTDLTALSSSLKNYVDAADTILQNNLDAVSGAIVSYVDAENAAQDAAAAAVSSSMKTYIDAQDTALSGAVDTRITALSGAAASALAAEIVARTAADSALSSSLKSYVDAQDTALSGAFDSRISALSGASKVYIDAQDNALSSSLKSYVDAADTVLQGNLDAVSGALKGAIDAEASTRAAEDLTFLKLDGSRSMSGNLNMGGNDIVSAKSGSFSGDVTVGGNLQVNGALTYVNSTNLEVTDKLITIAKGAVNGAAADGAGLYVDGAAAAFTWDNTSGSWVSSENIKGGVLISSAGSLLFDAYGQQTALSALSQEELSISGMFNTASMGAAVFQVPNQMLLGGAAFSTIATPVENGKYDVNAAIHALDVAVSSSNSGADAMKAAYDALRCVVTGTLSSGTVTVNLTTDGGAQFAVAEIANIALDVMVDADNTGFTNDLVAIKMFVDGAALKVQIDAPATPSAKYRLIAVNEKDGGLN